ncbi:hypothetical protein PIB30_097106 [Stylosanthes scabra]|uniref:Uncharacterized protein n=1 Tax=Stylosanthes scabra TaxID=79078 RepID=A0ABU6XX87_9FABA|nr:hypothetical protein [Stylosanthes scabra]
MLHQERGIVVGHINKQTPTLLKSHLTKSLTSFTTMWQTRRTLTLELSNQIYNKENPPKLLTKRPKILLILRIKEKEQKEAWKERKEQNRATGQKQSYSNQNRGLMPRRHYPRLGVAELASYLSLIQHSMPRRDARRLGMDGSTRKMALHQGLNA